MFALPSLSALQVKLVGAAVLLLLLFGAAWTVRSWHVNAVDAAYTQGSKDQAVADEKAFVEALVASKTKQNKTIADLTAKQTAITERKSDELAQATDIIDRRAAELRRMHRQAQAEKARGAGGSDPSAAVSKAASAADDAACTQAGGVPFDAALALAVDAEHDAAKLTKLQEWILEQEAAWPVNSSEVGK